MKAKEYYEETINVLRIAQYLKGRETIFMSPDGKIIRWIKCNEPSYLIKQMKHYDIIKNKFNIYHSIATYDFIPLFSYDIEKRKQQYTEWTQKEKYKLHIKGYDFYMDFDNKGDFELTYQEALKVSNFLKKQKIKHSVYFSGSGFHIRSELKKKNQNPAYCRKLANKLINAFGLETVDTSIYRWQGIIKTPFSIDFKSMNICTPIKDLKEFKKSDFNIK